MSRYKIEAFFREFPFLIAGDQPLVDQGRVEEVAVKRIDRNFLETTPYRKRIEMSLVKIDESQRVLLLDRDGVLAEVRQSRYDRSTIGRHREESKIGETVGDALARIPNADAIAYAVVITTGHRIEHNESRGGYSVLVYKPPRGFTLAGWVGEQHKRAEELIKAEIAEIDAEAEK